ncbi:MAG: DUF4198 domain-containing protein [Gemmatimonadaceae bacterium]|nr:DUF4198 domain-containing protein [Gemmatimonadaceae bacterium]
MRTLARATALAAAAAAAALVASAGLLAAHDMFLRPASHFARPNSRVLVRLLNGTFSKSENSIDRDRLVDVAVASPAGRAKLDTAQWSVQGDTSTFTLATGAAGTYVLGTSTRPRVLALPPKDFNQYLADDGMPDELAARKKDGTINQPSKERYHKHVKALVQVGDTPDTGFSTILGYPAEIVPLENPYALTIGSTLGVKILVDGKPVARQFVQYGGRTPDEQRVKQRDVRSDAQGIARIPLDRAGTYYVKFIDMRRLTGDAEANYESKWATLTFAMKK